MRVARSILNTGRTEYRATGRLFLKKSRLAQTGSICSTRLEKSRKKVVKKLDGDNKCSFPDWISVKPDGVNELDPCVYEEIAVYKNVTVTISKCEKCGNIDVCWERQDNTEKIW